MVWSAEQLLPGDPDLRAQSAIVDDATMTTTQPTTNDPEPRTAGDQPRTPRMPEDVPARLVLLATDDASVCIDDACLPSEEIE